MNSLLPTGSTVLERRAAEACAGISDLNAPLRDLWNPDRCPAKFLPYLAWAFSVDRWDEKWTTAEKRQAVKDAFYIHRRKGTIAAIRRVIETLGYSMSIEEWWQVADPAGTFRLAIDVNDIVITEAMISELERLIGDTKPVSRHLAQISLVRRVQGVAFVGVAAFMGEIVTVYPEGMTPDPAIKYDGLSVFDGNIRYAGR